VWPFLVVACRGGGSGTGESGDLREPAALALTVDPPSFELGAVPFGQTATSSVTIQNDGAGAVHLDLVPSSSAFTLEGPAALELAHGEARELTARYVATHGDGLAEAVELRADGFAPVVVPVSATTAFGQLSTWSGVEHDLGTVNVGCAETHVVVLVNRGGADVAVSDVSLTVDHEFVLTNDDGTAIATPFTLAPGTTAAFRLTFTPEEEHVTATAVEVRSNDPAQPVLRVDVAAAGHVVGLVPEVSLSWTVPAAKVLTALVHVNSEGVARAYAPEIEAALPTLFTGLAEAGVPYRIAIVGTPDGSGDDVAGSLDYIDESVPIDGAVDAASEMIAGLADDDNDRSLDTLEAAIGRNREWLLDEADAWRDSQLNLVAVNVDQEQSSRDAAYWVEQMRAYKGSPSDVVVHGLAGPPGSGCADGDGAWAALASPMLGDAVALTGGAFLSICDAWSANFAALATALLPRGTVSFPLTEIPDPSSLEVTVDGSPADDGWTYDAVVNVVWFDAAHAPAEGSVVRIDYGRHWECG
jgi:hypothetical protein